MQVPRRTFLGIALHLLARCFLPSARTGAICKGGEHKAVFSGGDLGTLARIR